MAMAKIDDVRNLKDDDCMDIAMRPLPRFGKRSSDLNRGKFFLFCNFCNLKT